MSRSPIASNRTRSAFFFLKLRMTFPTPNPETNTSHPISSSNEKPRVGESLEGDIGDEEEEQGLELDFGGLLLAVSKLEIFVVVEVVVSAAEE